MYCHQCGTENPDHADSCARCGSSLSGEGGGSGLATWSLITGVLGLCVPLLFLVAIVLGLVSLTSGRSGRGMAIAGLALGFLSGLLTLAGFMFFFTQVRTEGEGGGRERPRVQWWRGSFPSSTRRRLAPAWLPSWRSSATWR